MAVDRRGCKDAASLGETDGAFDGLMDVPVAQLQLAGCRLCWKAFVGNLNGGKNAYNPVCP